MLQLESLNISRNIYSFMRDDGTAPGGISGTIKIKGVSGTVEVRLTPKHIDRILAVVADVAVDNAREVANMLTREVIEHMQTALPLPAGNEAA